jgi:hypothetical protein
MKFRKNNLKFIGGMALALAFVLNFGIIDYYKEKKTYQSSSIQSHQYLNIVHRLKFLSFDNHSYPQTKEKWKELGKETFTPLGYIMSACFVTKKESKKIMDKHNTLLFKTHDSITYASLHNSIMKSDHEFGSKVHIIKEGLEKKIDVLTLIFNILSSLGLILIGWGEYSSRTKTK